MILKYWRYPAAILAIALLGLTIYNASWLAKAPPGTVKLIAHRGVYQQFDHAGVGRDTCTATRIEAPMHDYLENTVPSLGAAKRLGAAMIEVDIAPTKDGRIALFHDWTLDCRTEGTGETRGKTLDELKALDPGYGYSADGGKTFPLRGKGAGQIPSLEEALAVAETRPLLYNFKSNDAEEAELLAAALKAAGRDVEKLGDAFYGPPGPIARIKALYPTAWAFSKESISDCTRGYLKTGWFGVMPDACRNGTMMVPINKAWAFAGWPNKLQTRMAEIGGRVILIGPYGDDRLPMGLDLPEQIGKIPSSFTGWVWVEDIWTIGPALRPMLNKRNDPQEQMLERNLAARRAKRN